MVLFTAAQCVLNDAFQIRADSMLINRSSNASEVIVVSFGQLGYFAHPNKFVIF